MQWVVKKAGFTIETLGFLPLFLREDDPRPAREQFDEHYGWHPSPGFTMRPDGNLDYPGDPTTYLLVETKLRDEIIRVYEYSWVAVVQPDGSFEICRMD